MNIQLICTAISFLHLLTSCSSRYGEDKHRNETISFLKLTQGAEYFIPFELYNSNNKSQWIGIRPVGLGGASGAPDILAELRLINTSLVSMDIELLGYGLPYVSKIIKPSDEQVLTTGKLPQALMLKNVTGIPKGIIKIKTLTISNKPAGVIISKTIGRGGM